MESNQIRAMLADVDSVMEEAVKAANSAPDNNPAGREKAHENALNRLTVITGFGVKAILGLQLETVIIREQMNDAYRSGEGINDPSQISEKLKEG